MRDWPARRVGLAVVAGLLLLSAALLGQYTPLQAQGEESSEAEGAPRNVAGVRISGLSGTLTSGSSDSFTVEAFNLTTVLAYEVIVSRNNSTLGIGACGTASQSRSVSGVDSQRLTFTVHGCALGSGTVTAVVRRSGLTTNEGAASQGVTVQATPTVTATPQPTAPEAPARPTDRDKGPTRFTAQWQAPGTTGGAALTGYHVIMRANSAAWPPDSQAKKVGATTRSYTFTGLSPNRIYWFKVKACNGVNQTRCSGWSSQASVTLPIDNPGTPSWGSFSAEATQIRVRWSAPSYTGGASLTGYGLRHWRVGASEPSSAQVTVNAQTTSRTFSGLASDTSYRFSIQACNGPNRCSGWTNKDGRTDSAPEPDPPARVGRPTFSTIGPTAFTANWTAPNDHGTAIRGYGLQWRQRGSGWPSTTTWLGASARNRRVDGRAAGTTYVVRVKACNGSGANGRDRCGAWSSDGRVTTLAETAVPQNLDVAPLLGRQVELTWDPVDGANAYDVQAQVFGGESWSLATCAASGSSPSGARVSEPRCLINLLAITGSKSGLRQSGAFALQVRSVAGTSPSDFSEPVVVIDTPIVAASGASPSTGGQAALTWHPVQQTLGDTFPTGGTYAFRYRKVVNDAGIEHSELTWEPNAYVPVETTTSNPYTGLSLYDIYAIQLIYTPPQQPNQPARPRVFAARDVYVWPSDEAAGTGDRAGARVATFPLQYPLDNRAESYRFTYVYRICEETFPDVDVDHLEGRVGWVAFINDAVGQWADATGNLVHFKHEVYSADDEAVNPEHAEGTSKPCADHGLFARRIAEKMILSLSPAAGEDHTVDSIATYVQNMIARFRPISRLHNALVRAAIESQDEEVYNEIFMYEDDHKDLLFSELGELFDPFCNLAIACAPFRAIHPQKGPISDIALRRSAYIPDEGHFVPEIPNVQFEACNTKLAPNQNSAGVPFASRYSAIVHEVGHVLGIRVGSSGTGQQRHHPTIRDSVMNTKATFCAPTEFDEMTIHALYQSR